MTWTRFKFIDLFASIGGIRIPFDKFNGKCVFSSEIDPHCQDAKEELTDEWLGDVGFKYTQEERQPTKHWHLNLGWGAPNCRSCIEDLNIEVAGGAMHGDWFCWLRRGTRFSNNFVHVRHIKYRHELEDLITALTGTKWNPENCMYGNFYNDEIAATLRKKREEIPQPPESGGE